MKKRKILPALIFSVLLLAVLISGSVFAGSVQTLGLNKSATAQGTSRNAEVYQVNITKAGKLNVNLKHANLFDTKVYWTVEVLTADMETVLQTFNSIGTDTNLVGPSLGLSPGTYYIKVWSRKSCSDEYSDTPYTITPKFTQSSSWEVEYNAKTKAGNDQQGGSTTVALGKKAYGTMSSKNDIDFYQIKVTKSGYITLTFSHANVYDSNVCWKAELVNAKTKAICSVESKGTQKSVTTPKIGVTKGTYYIKITSGTTSYTTDYAVVAKFKSSNNWEKEYTNSGAKTNDSMSNANKISVGKGVSGTISSDTDVDFFSFKLSSSRNTKIVFSHDYKATKTKYWKIQVYNSKLKEVASFTSRGVDKNMQKSLNLKSGTYFVKVSKANKLRTQAYTLTIK